MLIKYITVCFRSDRDKYKGIYSIVNISLSNEELIEHIVEESNRYLTSNKIPEGIFRIRIRTKNILKSKHFQLRASGLDFIAKGKYEGAPTDEKLARWAKLNEVDVHFEKKPWETEGCYVAVLGDCGGSYESMVGALHLLYHVKHHGVIGND